MYAAQSNISNKKTVFICNMLFSFFQISPGCLLRSKRMSLLLHSPNSSKTNHIDGRTSERKRFLVYSTQMKPFHGSFYIHISNDDDDYYLPFLVLTRSNRTLNVYGHSLTLYLWSSNQFTDFFLIRTACYGAFTVVWARIFLSVCYFYGTVRHQHLSIENLFKCYSAYVNWMNAQNPLWLRRVCVCVCFWGC